MSRWVRTLDHNKLWRWSSDLGTAYCKERPPERDPLTAEQVRSLPDNTRVLVLWGGGNGPHEYIWRDARVFCKYSHQDRGARLGGLIGDYGLVGNRPQDDKVWLLEDEL